MPRHKPTGDQRMNCEIDGQKILRELEDFERWTEFRPEDWITDGVENPDTPEGVIAMHRALQAEAEMIAADVKRQKPRIQASGVTKKRHRKRDGAR